MQGTSEAGLTAVCTNTVCCVKCQMYAVVTIQDQPLSPAVCPADCPVVQFGTYCASLISADAHSAFFLLAWGGKGLHFPLLLLTLCWFGMRIRVLFQRLQAALQGESCLSTFHFIFPHPPAMLPAAFVCLSVWSAASMCPHSALNDGAQTTTFVSVVAGDQGVSWFTQTQSDIEACSICCWCRGMTIWCTSALEEGGNVPPGRLKSNEWEYGTD